jgi:hypothetical protein
MDMRQGIGQPGGCGCIPAGGRASLAGIEIEEPGCSAGGTGMKGTGPQSHRLFSLASIKIDLPWGLGHSLVDHRCRDVHAAILAQDPAARLFQEGQYRRLMDDDACSSEYLERTLVDLLNVTLCKER